MKKFLIVLLILVILMGAGAFYALNYYNSIGEAPLVAETDTIEVLVNPGDSFYGVLDTMDREGHLKSYMVTRLYFRNNPMEVRLQPGTYRVQSDASLEQLIETLNEARDIHEVVVTLPEGFTIERMGDVFEDAGMFSKEQFLLAAEMYPVPEWIEDTEQRRYAMEGFLRPDTYRFRRGQSADYVVDQLYKAFVSQMEAIIAEQGATLSTSQWNRVVTIAAMIEREAANVEEMPIIASVINNRLDIGMRLQLDATVVYALGLHGTDRVTYADLEVDSPYNTYRISGLPVGPIASPGRKAIEAVFQPAQTDYIYYVLDRSTGGHFFTDDYNEFLRVKNQQ